MSRDRVRQNYTVAGHECLASAAVWQMLEGAVFSEFDIYNQRKEIKEHGHALQVSKINSESSFFFFLQEVFYTL